tara:strand:- start:64 stop:270 length:207 start_codon:yes stop_codon:yes gene_type:complete
MRINKYIALKGKYSRREADKLITQGKINLNSKKATLGDQVQENDVVTMNGQKLEQKKYLLKKASARLN